MADLTHEKLAKWKALCDSAPRAENVLVFGTAHDFYDAARTAMPALIAEVERLQQRVSQLLALDVRAHAERKTLEENVALRAKAEKLAEALRSLKDILADPEGRPAFTDSPGDHAVATAAFAALAEYGR